MRSLGGLDWVSVRWTVNVEDDRSAALVISVWLEGEDQQFRGRLTARDTSPGSAPRSRVTVAAASSARDLLDAVSEWLDAFVHSAHQSIDSE